MPELGFRRQNRNNNNQSFRSSGNAVYRARTSPDSPIYSTTTPFSSSASASISADRSSDNFYDSLSSHFSQQMRAHDMRPNCSSGGPDPDPNKFTVHTNSGHKIDSETELGNGNQALDSARSSFSIAIRDCQDMRSRSESISRKSDRPRPASVDLNNHVLGTSPRFGALKKSLVSNRSGTFPSPVTPNYRHTGVSMQKGWSSERVPLPIIGNRKNVSGSFLPLNSGRTLPSKWEDAERWIFSPVSSGDGVVKPSVPPQLRKPKSKSGPLGPPGIAYYSSHSPAMPMFEAGNMQSFMADSPFSAGVMAADVMAIQCSSLGFPPRTEHSMARSASMHGCSEMLCLSHSSQVYTEHTCKKDEATNISSDASRRDMATQMSPEGSTHSSSLRPSTSSELQIVELQSFHLSKPEVRDVQVDEQITVTRWSKKHRGLVTGRGSDSVHDWPKNGLEARSAAWEESETAKSISRAKREDARITAWENLQKAKAEAEIRKLEMKLEKKRSSSMDKIMYKLRSAQKRAQDMRGSVLSKEKGTHQATRSSHKAISFRRPRQMTSLSGCFTCHFLGIKDINSGLLRSKKAMTPN